MSSSTLIQTQDVTSDALEMARSVFAAGDYDEVVRFTEAATYRPCDEKERFALLLLRAASFGERQNYKEAFDTLETASAIIERASGMSKARFFCQRAYLHVKLDRADEALVDYEAARFWARESGDLITEATARNNIAKQYGNAGRLEEALAESEAAIKIGEKLESNWRLGRYYDQRAGRCNPHANSTRV